MAKIAVVGCGASKKAGFHEARNLYTSNYFQLKKEFAEEVCDVWFIYSAKYGLIRPDKEIESYDKTVSDMSKDEVQELARGVAQELHVRTDELGKDSTIYWLAGEDYVKPVERLVMDDEIEPFNPTSSLPFRNTSGIGEQMAWLKQNIRDAGKTEQNATLGDFS